jgi:TolB-like protein/Tfp pilus assembly protein PilF
MIGSGLYAELKRRNVLRASLLYAGTVWALAQGIAQLGPSIGAPEWITRWFLVAAAIGFPLWIAFAWFYEFTPQGLKRESEIALGDSIARSTGRKLDFWIIGVLAVAVVLLLTNQFVLRGDATSVAGARAAAATLAKVPDKSIAVLPLDNASGDQDQLYFSDGLSEDLITALSQFDGLKVISRNSAFQFRDSKESASAIGAKLGVAHLLEGSVRRLGDTVRITAQLVNAADGSTMWSQHYDRPYQDLFAMLDEIARAVAGALKARLLPGAGQQGDHPPSGNLAAYNAYLQGKFYGARSIEADLRKATDAYATAIRLDPRYALAWAQMSRAWAGLAGAYLAGKPAQQAYAQARTAAATALALAPDLADAHRARGYLFLTADFNWTAAEAEYRRAVQLAPNDAAAKFELGNLLATLGQPGQAVDLSRQALAANPLSATSHLWLANYLLALGRYDEATQAIGKAIELQPDASSFHEVLTLLQIQRGDARAALAAARQEPAGIWQKVALALALQIGDDHTAADAALQTLIDAHSDESAYQIAEVYALRKDPDAMFAWLDRAWANRDPGVSLLLYDPVVLRYRDDPRFAAFCRKVGLPVPGKAA